MLSVPLDAVLRTTELDQRAARTPDYRSQSEALEVLARALADSPRDILTTLCQVAQNVCGAGSAGISLLSRNDGGATFWWPAITGRWREHAGGGTPREFGPCGIVLDRDRTQLFTRPERYYPYIRGVAPQIEEALLAPFHAHGRPVGTVWVLSHDATRRFDAEDRRQLESLATFASAAYQLLESLDAFREADRRKDEFLATLAHELRNPLAPIRTGLSILNVGGSAEQQARTRQMMERQVRHLVHMVDDLLDLSRISQGKIVLKKSVVDLREVLHGAIEIARPLIEANRHEFIMRLADGPLTVDADPTRLAQVIANLLNNAARYTPPGGRLELHTAVDGPQLLIRVSDNGIGIPEEMLPQIFDLFVQVGGGSEHAQGGLGIGLTLVRGLVELHGGSIAAASGGPGQGTTMTVRLPLAEPRAATDTGDETGTQRGTAHRILVVDDNTDAASSLAMLLELDGHVTRVAHSGAHALAAIPDFAPHIVFLDIGLPDINGYEVARRVRAMEGLRTRPRLIALTGWGSEEDRRQAADAGFDAHLVKPVDPAGLGTVLG